MPETTTETVPASQIREGDVVPAGLITKVRWTDEEHVVLSVANTATGARKREVLHYSEPVERTIWPEHTTDPFKGL